MSLLKLTIKTVTLLSLLISNTVLATSHLPLPPKEIQNPYQNIKVQQLNTGQDLISYFDKNGYQLKLVKENGLIPEYYIDNLPHDLNKLSVEEKTTGFIRLLLPTIQAVNDQVLAVRSKLLYLSHKSQITWSEKEQDWVQHLMASYNVKSNRIEDLLLQIDMIPVGMALAQGIDESGWGTSYFAIEGNNLYGEHSSGNSGKFLTTPNGRVRVSAFENLYLGTASYMHNLNTTYAYQGLWQLRKHLREHNNLTGDQLVQALEHYSTRGESYVDNLRNLIKVHKLDDFDNIAFDSTKIARFHFR